MRVDKTRGTLVIRLGKRFVAADVERISEAVLAAAPLSALTLNFADVEEFDFSAIFPLIGILEALQDVKVVFLGLTLHQRRMLKYFGVRHGEPESGGGIARSRTSAPEPAVGSAAAEGGVFPEELGELEPAPWEPDRRGPPSELKAVLESMTTGVVTYDMSGRLVSRNKAARLLIPLTSAERDRLERERAPLLVVKGRWLDGSPIRAEETGVARALRGEESESLVIRIQGDEPDARPNVFSVRTAPLLDEAGAVVGAVTALTDITRAHDLHEQHEDLLRAVCHDVRAPLGAILLNAGLIERVQDAPEGARKAARAIAENVRRIDTSLRDVLDMGRLAAGTLRAQLERVPLRGFVGDMTRRVFLGRDLERIHLDVEEVACVEADPRLLERVLTNLLTNALKYSPPDTPVVICAEREGRNTAVSIVDRGPGISMDEQARMFSRFFRGRGAELGKDSVGLGLYAAKVLAEAQGGSVHLRTSPGAGSEFRVLLLSCTAPR